MNRLLLHCLGTPEVRLDGQLLAFPTRKALALLIYLTTENRVHARETLTALFWPESGASQGRATLRSTLASLRDALGKAAAHLVADRDSLRFEFSPDVDFDLRLLETAAQIARQPLTAQPQSVRSQLAAAASLVRGDFLEGFSLSDAPEFDNWASLQREMWHRKASTVFDALSQLQFWGGEVAQAIETTARWLRHDPLNEAAHRRLMLGHFTAGNRTAALQAYAACCAVLERELNADPSPETEALADRLRTQPPPSSEPVGQESTSASPTYDVPLIGRADEHLELVTAYRAARRGQPQLFSLEGEPGIGKTRLAREFATWAAAQGATVLQGRAFEMGNQMPYQPVVEALRSISDFRLLLADFNRLAIGNQPSPFSRVWLAELTRLLPELHDDYPGLPAPLPLAEAESRARLFEAVTRLGQALANRPPFVLFIDDLHWADAASLDLVAYASRRWAAANTPALILFTARSEELTTLADWLSSLARDLTLTRLVLNPLTEENTLALMKSLESNWGLAIENYQSLLADTGGHPLFILETVKALREQGNLSGTPPGVREVIHNRLLRLSANARAACSAAAVLGGQFEFGPLCRVAALSEADGLPALEELLQRGLLRERGARYLFSHDKIREVAYAEISAARRQVFHRRALETLGLGAASPGELARHALAAGSPERAFHLLVQAGDEVMRLFAARNAIAYYEQARVLTPTIPSLNPDLQSLPLQLGRAYELANQWNAAGEAYEAALTSAREANRPELECAALNHLALVAAKTQFDIPRAAALLGEAQQAAERSGDKLAQAETEMNLSQMGLYRWDAAGMLSHAERALTLGRELDRPEIVARCLNMAAYAGVVSGRWEMIEARAAESRALYAQLGNRLMEADGLALVGAIKTQSGQPREGAEIGRAAYSIVLELENEWGQANGAYPLAHALFELGEYGEALTVARAGVAAARIAGHPPLLVFNLLVLGENYRALFALDEARAAHGEALALAQMLRHPFLIEWAAAQACADESVAGNWSQAYAHAEQVLAIRAVDPTLKAFAALTLWHETEALVQAGEIERATADVERHGKHLTWTLHHRYRLPYLRALAALARYDKRELAALAYLREAVALAEAIGLPGELWQLYIALGEQERAAEILQSLGLSLLAL